MPGAGAFSLKHQSFDPTLGFPGEGPFPGGGTSFLHRASSILQGDSKVRGLPQHLLWGFPSDEQIHGTLVAHCVLGNRDHIPVASRFQTNSRFVATMATEASIATKVALQGAVFDFDTRPVQSKRPRPINLPAQGKQFFLQEVQRLHEVCGAIERAPDHDGDLPLDSRRAEPYELREFPMGPWPTETQVPALKKSEWHKYNQKQVRIMQKRVSKGLPFRDFEAAGFTVPKPGGKLRLCMDERGLNDNVTKQHFKLEGVQQACELVQPGDWAIILDLEDCYLQVGLSPPQRKYFRFRDPLSRRWQWKTLCFGAGPCPRIVTKIMKPLVQRLRALGIRCVTHLDDLITLDQDRLRCARAAWVALELLQLSMEASAWG